MNTSLLPASPLSRSLRTISADCLRIALPHAAPQQAPQDHHPLRRPINRFQDMEVWETNENMCFALWELMARS